MFRKIVLAVVLSAIITGSSTSAFGWDETGHKITAYIAWQRMSPEVRERVINTLLAAPEDSHIGAYFLAYGSRPLESRKREYFMLMSTWPDIVKDKSLPVRNKKYDGPTWHYSDTFWRTKDGKVEYLEQREDGGLGLAKLIEFDQLLRSPAANSEKAIAVAWIEHIIGDLHQPLHTSAKVSGSSQKGDQGGNLFFLTPKGTKRAEQDNLHRFWDGIVSRNIPNQDQCDADYVDPIAADIIKSFPYDKLSTEIKSGQFDAWVKESLDIATSESYRGIKFFEAPGDDYKKKAFQIGRKRMALAGYRMADLFERIFATPVMPEKKPS
jgi:hypothetical protein